MNVTLRQLRAFLAVARTGSFTLAAESLYISQSALSGLVKELEQSMGVRLIDRSTRRVHLTEAGERLSPMLETVLHDLDEVLHRAVDDSTSQKGVVRVAVSQLLASTLMPDLIARFQAEHPGGSVKLVDVPVEDVMARVFSGEVDIGITVSTVSERGISVALRHPSPIIAVLHPEHPLAGRGQLSLAQLVGHAVALPGPDSTLRQLFDISCSRQGLDFEAVFECDRLDPCLSFVRSGGGITLNGELALRERLRRGEVVGIPLRDREMNERHFEVQTLAGRTLPRAAKAFLEHLLEALGRPG